MSRAPVESELSKNFTDHRGKLVSMSTKPAANDDPLLSGSVVNEKVPVRGHRVETRHGMRNLPQNSRQECLDVVLESGHHVFGN